MAYKKVSVAVMADGRFRRILIWLLASIIVVSVAVWGLMRFHPVAGEPWFTVLLTNSQAISVANGSVISLPKDTRPEAISMTTQVLRTEAMMSGLLGQVNVRARPFRVRSASILSMYTTTPGEKVISPAVELQALDFHYAGDMLVVDLPTEPLLPWPGNAAIAGEVALSYWPVSGLIPAGWWAPDAPKVNFILFFREEE